MDSVGVHLDPHLVRNQRLYNTGNDLIDSKLLYRLPILVKALLFASHHGFIVPNDYASASSSYI